MSLFLLAIFGLIIGSFLNVVILRYNENAPLLSPRIIGGRSKCMTCQVGLKWYELVPLFSFLVQGARCRHCKHSLNWQYPVVEFLAALATVAIPAFFFDFYSIGVAAAHGGALFHYIALGAWLIIGYTTIVLSAIDLRLRIIPDQCNLLLMACALVITIFRQVNIETLRTASFSGAYATVFGGPLSPLTSSLVGVLFALALFGGTIYFSKGRGMGMGDLKLALPLGILLGWPDSLVAFMSAFIVGSIIGLLLLAGKRSTLKSMVPFGPFIVVGLYIAIFYSESLLRWYFSLA